MKKVFLTLKMRSNLVAERFGYFPPYGLSLYSSNKTRARIMRYVLAVKSPIYGQQGAFLAYQFAKALIEKKHEIAQIFLFPKIGCDEWQRISLSC